MDFKLVLFLVQFDTLFVSSVTSDPNSKKFKQNSSFHSTIQNSLQVVKLTLIFKPPMDNFANCFVLFNKKKKKEHFF